MKKYGLVQKIRQQLFFLQFWQFLDEECKPKTDKELKSEKIKVKENNKNPNKLSIYYI